MMLLALRLAGLPGAGEPVSLRYQWTVGQKVEFRTTLQAQALIQMNSGPLALPIQGRFSYTLECLAVEEGQATLKVNLGELKMVSSEQELKTEADSAPPFILVMDAFGKPLEIRGLQEGENAPELAGLNFYYQYFLLQLAPFAFPDKPLSPSETWLTAAEVVLRGSDPLSLKSASRFQGLEVLQDRNCAKISTNVKLPVKIRLPQFGNVEVSGKMEGTIITHFALDEGQVLQSTSQIQAQVAVSGVAVSGPNQAPQDLQANVQAQLQMKRLPASQS
jgi:hypothetical protein